MIKWLDTEPMPSMNITAEQKKILISLARQSIEYGLETNKPLVVAVEGFPESIQNQAACFVSLHKKGQLRGCIGALEAYEPLVQNVARNAYSSAFNDNRFPSLSKHELPDTRIEISVLSIPSKLNIDSEQDLYVALRPNYDGVILVDGFYRATYLPCVWEQLSGPVEFIQSLKQKAGLDVNYWSDSIEFFVYHTDVFSED